MKKVLLKRSVLAVLLAVGTVFSSCTRLTTEEAQLIADLRFDRDLVAKLKAAVGSGVFRGEHGGISFEIPPERFEGIIKTERERCAGRGYLLFRSEMNFGLGGKKDVVTLIQGNDPLDIVRLVKTDGINYGLENRDVIAKLEEWNARYHFYIVGAGLDWIDARFTESISDMDSFAEEVAAFCPDIVEQGTGSVENLSREMRRTASLWLWWD